MELHGSLQVVPVEQRQLPGKAISDSKNDTPSIMLRRFGGCLPLRSLIESFSSLLRQRRTLLSCWSYGSSQKQLPGRWVQTQPVLSPGRCPKGVPNDTRQVLEERIFRPGGLSGTSPLVPRSKRIPTHVWPMKNLPKEERA